MPKPGVGETSALPVSCHLSVPALFYYIQRVVPLLESVSFPFKSYLETIFFPPQSPQHSWYLHHSLDNDQLQSAHP